MRIANPTVAMAVGTMLLCLVAGCSKNDGPEVGYVTGLVTLNSQPLSNATVEFVPVDNPTQRPSTAITDSNGKYDLFYSATRKGAALGQHTVTIKKFKSDSSDTKESTVLTPAKYAKPGELKAKVEKGSQTIDFDLKS